MTVQSPIKNDGLYYISGLGLANDATTPDEIVTIASGAARNSTNVNDIVVASALSVNNTVSGVNGLDTGSVAASTLYAVHVISDSAGFNSAAGLLSLSATAPTLPFGYDMFRRVGWVLTDGTSDFLVFDQRGSSSERTMWYHASVATDITAGTSAAFAAVDLSDSVPAGAKEVVVKCTFTPTAGNDELNLRSGDSAVDEGQATLSGSVAAVVKIGHLRCPMSATAATGVSYKVTGSATALNVQGYVDELGL